MNVYDLILERGTVGALLYANEIENKNLRLATKIDEAVSGLLKFSQLPGFANIPNQTSNPSIPTIPTIRTIRTNPTNPTPATSNTDGRSQYDKGGFIGKAITDEAKNTVNLQSINISIIPNSLRAISNAPFGCPKILKPLLEKLASFIESSPNSAFNKILAPVAFLFDTWDITNEIEKREGVDSEILCKVVGAITDALQAALATGILATGGALAVVEPILAPLSLFTHFGGCWLIGTIFGRKDAPKDQKFTSDDVKNRSNSVQSSDLTSGDLSKLQTMANDSIENNTSLLHAVGEGVDNRVFDHPLDVIALAYKFKTDTSAIPGVNQKPTNTSESTSGDSSSEETKTSKFNYYQYRLAFNN